MRNNKEERIKRRNKKQGRSEKKYEIIETEEERVKNN